MKEMKPPRWCPDAVATVHGWRHPKTNELLVAIRGLLSNVNYSTEPEKMEAPVEVIEQAPVEVAKKPAKKTTKKTAKKTAKKAK